MSNEESLCDNDSVGSNKNTMLSSEEMTASNSKSNGNCKVFKLIVKKFHDHEESTYNKYF